ncbi:phage holin family protein [Neglectibacter caecimuris]|uniref:phage holin family protein n=1 Tax=Neglectibacter caecimuris TaxID=3093658 RepID=UPI002AC9C5B7|nr:phage holin family protein [Neglectibacter sp. M00184]
MKNMVLGVLAMIGSALSNLLGGWDITLQILLCCMAADYITGLVVAGVFHNSGKTQTGALESRAGFKGLVRKCAILLLVFLAALLDAYTGHNFVRPAVCMFFVANEGLSILENIGLMGVPYPAFLENMLEALKKQGNDGNGEEE